MENTQQFDIAQLRKKYSNLTRNNEDLYININPLQRGGVLTEAAEKALIQWGDGYSFCDNCLKGRIEKIENPPVPSFYQDLAKFLGSDHSLVSNACRDSKKLVFWALKRIYPESPSGDQREPHPGRQNPRDQLAFLDLQDQRL